MALNFRQVFLRVFKGTQNALRIIDVGPESLETVETQTVTVSTTVLGIDSWFPTLNGTEQLLRFQVISGGPINVNVAVGRVPSAGGTEGSSQAKLRDTIIVTGPNDIARFQAVLATTGSDAEVRGSLARRTA